MAVQLRTFFVSTSGNVIMIFALCFSALALVMGIALDMNRGVSAKTEAQYAADATALAAVRETDLNAAELTEWARDYFDDNFGISRMESEDNFRVRRIDDETVTVEFTGALKTTFAAIMGREQLDFSVTSTASHRREYLDIYFVLDRSASMLIADGEDAIDDMMDLTKPWILAYGDWFPEWEPEGCAFACHIPGPDPGGEPWVPGASTLMEIAATRGIPLRNQRVMASALEVAETVAASREGVRFATVDFGSDARLVQRLTSNLMRIRSALDVTVGTEVNRWDTDFPELFDFLEGEIMSAGSGSQASPRKMVILITDGLYTHGTHGYNYEPFHADFCDTLKARGVKIAVINTVYDQLPDSMRYVRLGIEHNSNMARGALETCATEGFYFQANEPDEIDQAFADLAAQILDDPLRLTN